MRRPNASATGFGCILGVIVVLLAATGASQAWDPFPHPVCSLGSLVGNVTVWAPAAVVAAPFGGTEHGTIVTWGKSSVGYTTLSSTPTVTGGNVTAFYVGYENWSIYRQSNKLQVGLGSACASPLVAFSSVDPPQDLRSGGITSVSLVVNAESDVAMPGRLNASELCAELELTPNPDCGVSAVFDMNFTKSSGSVDTCGKDSSQTLSLSIKAWPAGVPYLWNGDVQLVPYEPRGPPGSAYVYGTYAGYNYTFPAEGGIWHYDNLGETGGTGAGLSFSYTACP